MRLVSASVLQPTIPPIGGNVVAVDKELIPYCACCFVDVYGIPMCIRLHAYTTCPCRATCLELRTLYMAGSSKHNNRQRNSDVKDASPC